MDCNKTINFLKEVKRCCEENNCDTCPINLGESFVNCDLICLADNKIEEIISRVQEWCDKHPRKTYKQDLLEKLPHASVDTNGVPMVCRKYIYDGECLIGALDELVPLPSSDNPCLLCWNEEMR